MAITLTLQTDETMRVLATMEGHLQNLGPPLEATKELLLTSVRDNFAQGGRPQPWAPLRRSRRRGSLGSAIPLNDTGVLRASIAGEVSGNTVTIGTNLAYAAIHNFGGTVSIPEIVARPGHALRWIGDDGQPVFARRVRAHTVVIPQREFLVIQDQDITDIVEVFQKYITGGA